MAQEAMKTYAQTELHRHLDVSLRLGTLLELAQERGLEAQSTSLEGFREKILITEPMSDLHSVLARFSLFQHVLDHPDVLTRVAKEVIEDCLKEGTQRVELRFSPSFVCELSHLPWEDALDGFEAGLRLGLKENPSIKAGKAGKAGLICIASRDFGVDSVERTVEFFLKHKDRFIGLDLAGNEAAFPCRLYEKSFQKALAAGANITVHAGEGSGAENIWEAIELLGAKRIGHGIACVADPKLMEYLRDNLICLEICPTSNWLTKSVPSLKAHPLPSLLRAGLRVSINTDDPCIFGTTLTKEIEICKKQLGLSDAEINLCFQYATEASFL